MDSINRRNFEKRLRPVENLVDPHSKRFRADAEYDIKEQIGRYDFPSCVTSISFHLCVFPLIGAAVVSLFIWVVRTGSSHNGLLSLEQPRDLTALLLRLPFRFIVTRHYIQI